MTESSTQLTFPDMVSRPVVVDFEGDRITSDGGFVILREADERSELTSRLAGWPARQSRSGQGGAHQNRAIAPTHLPDLRGYGDCNDADFLRTDPALKIAVGRMPESAPHPSSQPTLSRFENAVTERELKRISGEVLAGYLDRRPARPSEL